MVLTDDQKALQETARRFARERLLPHYQKREKARRPRPRAHRRDGPPRPARRRPARGAGRPRASTPSPPA